MLHVACLLPLPLLLQLFLLLLMACLAVAHLRYAFTTAIAAAVAIAAADAIATCAARTLTKVVAFHLRAAFAAFDFNGYATYHVAPRRLLPTGTR